MKFIDYFNTSIDSGIWKEKQDLNRATTIYSVYYRFKETGRFDAFKCNWKEGMPFKPHFFWDSDIAKWLESVAYLTKTKREKDLEVIVDKTVDLIEKNQDENGYFNIYFTVVEPDKRFTYRSHHELYCAGHLIEAAVAYYNATGKRKFLDLMCRYVNYIEQRFIINKDTAFTAPGHEEIELALIKLYECTGEKRYLDISKHFVDIRGTKEDIGGKRYDQSDKPVRQQTTAEGHAVRAVYLYCAMADVAYYTGDKELENACIRLFSNIVNKRMYITGGIGSSSVGEAFTVDYDLPNLISYTETCAAIGLALFAMRMLRLDNNSVYSDVIEKIIYNGFLSSLSLDGRSFYYENPCEIIPYLHYRDVSYNDKNRALPLPKTLRSEVFDCSCCPPNITRFIASIANLIYTADDDMVYVHQFIQSKTETVIGGKKITLRQLTRYPENGKVRIKVSGGNVRLAVRIPGWYDGADYKTEKGYAYFEVADGQTLEFDFKMKVKFIQARPEAVFDAGRYAVTRGPVIYCSESVDNGANLRDIRIDSKAKFSYGKNEALGVPSLKVKAYRTAVNDQTPLYSEKNNAFAEFNAELIPYYAFANRGESEMLIWHLVK